METLHSFERHCFGDVCHCDFRVSITGCEESEPARIINIINIALSALLTIVGLGLLYHRIIIKGYTFLDLSPKKGLLRPKPIDSMLLFITIFNAIRLTCSIVLVLDVAADNMTFRSFIYEGGFQWGLTAFNLYLIGIAQTLAESHKAISDSWLPSPFIVDTIGLSIIIASHAGVTIFAVAAGAFAKSNVRIAENFITANYILWFVLTTGVSCSVLYCGSRLIKTLQSHIKRFNTSNERYLNIKNGIFKIRAMMGLIVICLLGFAVIVLVYGIIRNATIDNHYANIILCAALNMLGPVTIMFILASVIFNSPPSPSDSPKGSNSESKDLKLKNSGEERSTTLYDSYKTTKFDTSMTFKDTMSHFALEDLNSKYDDLIKNPNGKPDYTSPASLDTNFQTKKRKDLNVEDHEDFEIQRTGSQIQLIHA